MAGWDDDDDDDSDGDGFSLDGGGWDTWELPDTWDAWWEFDWESYDGDYEEYAVSADYGTGES